MRGSSLVAVGGDDERGNGHAAAATSVPHDPHRRLPLGNLCPFCSRAPHGPGTYSDHTCKTPLFVMGSFPFDPVGKNHTRRW